MKEVLIHTINKTESISEVYIHPDQRKITEVKYLNHNRIKRYTYSVEKFLATSTNEELKSKISQFSTEKNKIKRDPTANGYSGSDSESLSNKGSVDFIKPLGNIICPV